MIANVLDTEETICAVASAPTGAARGIVRVSGPAALSVVAKLLVSDDPFPERMGKRIEGFFQLPAPLGDVAGAALLWPTEKSYTGQPAAELHLPGCLPLLDAAVEALVHAGARPARPGEFTLRAFLAGRLDLTQAEAVLGVIDADDQQSLQFALHQLAGGLSEPLQDIRLELLGLLSHLEAGLDFVEEDIEFISTKELVESLGSIQSRLLAVQQQMSSRVSSKDLPLIVLRGRPNVGKSRLLNALSGEEAAIVADIAGTTRDSVQVVCQLNGHTVCLTDTAGLEEGRNPIEREAQQLAAGIEQRATIRVFCSDRPETESTLLASADSIPTVLVKTKSDLSGGETPAESGWLETSSETGAGIDTLRSQLAELLDQSTAGELKGIAGTAARCADSLQRGLVALDDAVTIAVGEGGQELVAAEMRFALAAIGEVTGEVYTDDILDRIFSRFCIGK